MSLLTRLGGHAVLTTAHELRAIGPPRELLPTTSSRPRRREGTLPRPRCSDGMSLTATSNGSASTSRSRSATIVASLLEVSAVSTTRNDSLDKRAGRSLPRTKAATRSANCGMTESAARLSLPQLPEALKLQTQNTD